MCDPSSVYAAVADVKTRPTSNAALGIKKQFRFYPLRFGIVTPCAAQGTALKKDRCADPGTVVHAKALDFGYF